MTLAGVVYAKGLGAHAASDIRYAMNGSCTTFSAKVGVDDEVGTNGTVDFQVFADGDQAVRLGRDDRRPARPDGHASTSPAGRPSSSSSPMPATATRYDHADWADAKLTCGG